MHTTSAPQKTHHITISISSSPPGRSPDIALMIVDERRCVELAHHELANLRSASRDIDTIFRPAEMQRRGQVRDGNLQHHQHDMEPAPEKYLWS